MDGRYVEEVTPTLLLELREGSDYAVEIALEIYVDALVPGRQTGLVL